MMEKLVGTVLHSEATVMGEQGVDGPKVKF